VVFRVSRASVSILRGRYVPLLIKRSPLVGPFATAPMLVLDAYESNREERTDPMQLSNANDKTAIDPVCGMTVDPATARGNELHSQHKDIDYYFCGRGCKLEFGDNPNRYLDPAYVPSM
jgi:YHS domain-containing protein